MEMADMQEQMCKVTREEKSKDKRSKEISKNQIFFF